MNRIISSMVLIMAVMISVPAFAQSEGHHKKRSEARAQMEAFFETLDLTDTQVEQLEAERERMQDEMKALRDSERSKETREKMDAIREDHRLVMQDILTTEQFAAFEKKSEEVKGNRRHKRGERPDKQ